MPAPLKNRKRGLLGPGLLFLCGAALLYYSVSTLYTMRTTQMPWDYWLELYLEKNAQPEVYPTFDSANRIDLLSLSTKQHISVFALFGSAFIVGAIAMWLRRYSLRVLLCAVFACGLAAAIPFSFSTSAVPRGRPLRVQGGIRLGVPLSTGQVKAIQEQLQPDAAMQVFPAELWKQIGMEKKDGIHGVSFLGRSTGYGTQILEMELFLRDGLTRAQADTLAAFYWWYVKTLSIKAATQPLPKAERIGDNFEGLWNEHWQSISERALPAEKQ